MLQSDQEIERHHLDFRGNKSEKEDLIERSSGSLKNCNEADLVQISYDVQEAEIGTRSSELVQVQDGNKKRQEPEKDYLEDKNSGIPFDRGWAWIISLSCFVIFFIYSVHDQVLAALVNDVIDELDTNLSVLSAVSVVGTCAYCLATLLSASFLLPHFPGRSVVTWGAIINGAATLVFVLRPNIKMLFIISFLKNLAKGVTLVASLTLVCSYFRRRTALATSLAFMGSSACFIIMPTLARYLREEYGFRSCFVIIAGLEFQAILVTMLLRPVSGYTKRSRKLVTQDVGQESGPLLSASSHVHCPANHSARHDTEQKASGTDAAAVKYLDNGLYHSCRESPANTGTLFIEDSTTSIVSGTENITRRSSPHEVKERITFLQDSVGHVDKVVYTQYNEKHSETPTKRNLNNEHILVLDKRKNTLVEQTHSYALSYTSASSQDENPIDEILEEKTKPAGSKRTLVIGEIESASDVNENSNLIINDDSVQNYSETLNKETLSIKHTPKTSLQDAILVNQSDSFQEPDSSSQHLLNINTVYETEDVPITNQSNILATLSESTLVAETMGNSNINTLILPGATVTCHGSRPSHITYNCSIRPLLNTPNQEKKPRLSKTNLQISSLSASVSISPEARVIHSNKESHNASHETAEDISPLRSRPRHLHLDSKLNPTSLITPISDRVDISMARPKQGYWFSIESMASWNDDVSPDSDLRGELNTDTPTPTHTQTNAQFWRCSCSALLVDFSLLKNWLCILLILTYCTVNIGLLNLPCLQTHAINVGISSQKADILTIVFGAMGITGRIISGIFADLKTVLPNKIMAAAMVAVGLLTHFVWLFQSFTSLLVFASMLGFLSSVGQNLATVYILEVMGLEHLAKVLALCTLFLGLYLTAHSQIQNAFREYTGSCMSTFHYIGIIDFLAALLLLSEPIIRHWLEARASLKQINWCR